MVQSAKKGILTKILAFSGTVLVWLPLLAPFIFAGLFFFRTGRIQVDYLIPAEVFPIVLLASGLLYWAALRSRLWQKLIGWSLVAAVVFLFGSQALAEVTGLASGAIEPVGWQWWLTLAGIFAYDLAVLLVGIGGVLLLRDLFKTASPQKENFQVKTNEDD
jgi:hypothetical protein